jgi:predicted small metal-binding protein
MDFLLLVLTFIVKILNSIPITEHLKLCYYPIRYEKITCREAGFDCNYVVKGETGEEVMKLGAEHAMKAHGMKEEDITPDKYDTIHTASSIYRVGHSDTWACKNCNQRGDKWFMQNHCCREPLKI